MRFWSDSFTDGGLIPPEFAFAEMDPAAHVRLSDNLNPHLAWEDLPAGTQSLILLCRDIDAPTIRTDVNQEDRKVAAALVRADFFHWTLADIPPSVPSLAAGAFSSEVVPQGKPGPDVRFIDANGVVHYMRQGINDFTGWFANDPAMAGDYFGYDGPCPPWNDMLPHTYAFTLYALDVPRLDLESGFTGPEALAAIRGHILDEARILGVYSLNPEVAAALAL